MTSVPSRTPPPCGPIAVRECEFTAPLAALDIEGAHVGVRVLARWHGEPVGWLHFAGPSRVVPPMALATALIEHCSQALERIAFRQSIEPPATSQAHPPITVVVCTRDRTENLARCLSSLRDLRYPAYEVLVVDNAPTTDQTERLVADRSAHWPALRYTRERRPGLDWARNRGLDEASYDIVAYTDDDVRVDRLWLQGLARGFRDSDAVLVTGLVAPAELESDPQIFFEDVYGGMGKGLSSRCWDPRELGVFTRVGAHHLGVGANMAFRRDWLRGLDGFDTALDVGTPSHGGGDLDIFHRTLAAGGVVRYEPSALVWHYHRRGVAALERQLRDNGRAFGVYLLTRARYEPARVALLRYAAGTWLRWLVVRVLRRVTRQEAMPLPLQAREWLGALQAPFAWIATYRHDHRVRAAHPARTSAR